MSEIGYSLVADDGGVAQTHSNHGTDRLGSAVPLGGLVYHLESAGGEQQRRFEFGVAVCRIVTHRLSLPVPSRSVITRM